MKHLRMLVSLAVVLGAAPSVAACARSDKCGPRPLFAQIGSTRVDLGACNGQLGAPVDENPANLPVLDLKVGETISIYVNQDADAAGLESSDPGLVSIPTGNGSGMIGSFKAVGTGSAQLTLDPSRDCGPQPAKSRCAIAIVNISA